MCLIRGDEIWVANAGDSRTVLVKQEAVIQVTTDHKPNEPSEKARILAAGGSIIFYGVWRVNGIIFFVITLAAASELSSDWLRHAGHVAWIWRCVSQTRSTGHPPNFPPF